MKAKVVGVSVVQYTNKKDKEVNGVSIHIIREPSKRESENHVGQFVETVWVAAKNADVFRKVGKELIGKNVEFAYEMDGRFLSLTDITVVA